jgi:uncharacterized membrane protein YhfC
MTTPIIPDLTIIFSAISLAISVLLPIGGIIFCRLKYKMPLYPVLFGAATFFLFVLILESAANNFLLGVLPIQTNPVLFVVYGVLAAGIFEETGRLISFTIIERVSKKQPTSNIGVSYGFGHGGFESIVLVGMVMLNNVAISIANNDGSLYTALSGQPTDVQSRYVGAVMQLTATPSWQFLMGGLERVIAIAAQLAFSVIMFYAVFGKRKIWLYPVAILAHALTDVPAMLNQVGAIKNLVVVECITAFIAAAVVVFAVWVNDKYKGELSGNSGTDNSPEIAVSPEIETETESE